MSRSYRTFLVVWVGQLVSTLGSTMTAFAVSIWVYQETGSVTRLAIVTLAVTLPGLVVGPFAGVLADRLDRRTAMLGADLVAASATLTLAILFLSGSPSYWVIVLAALVYGTSAAVQEPAYQAAVPTLVGKERLGKANGLVQLGPSVGTLLAPVAAGGLMFVVGVHAVLWVDLGTFVVALTTLLAVRFPDVREPVVSPDRPSLLREAREGFRYLVARSGLVGLLMVYAAFNFFLVFANVLTAPLLLAFANEAAVGTVMSAVGMASVAGSVALGAWGGPRHRVPWILAMLGTGAAGLMLVGFRPSVWAVGAGWAVVGFLAPMANGTSQALWQTKVAPAVQGRVFAARRMVGSGISPLAYLLAGPVADHLFEPLMMPGGRLAGALGPVLGTGPGRGMGLLYVVVGLACMLVAAAGWLHPRVRFLEVEIPDALPVMA